MSILWNYRGFYDILWLHSYARVWLNVHCLAFEIVSKYFANFTLYFHFFCFFFLFLYSHYSTNSQLWITRVYPIFMKCNFYIVFLSIYVCMVCLLYLNDFLFNNNNVYIKNFPFRTVQSFYGKNFWCCFSNFIRYLIYNFRSRYHL